MVMRTTQWMIYLVLALACAAGLALLWSFDPRETTGYPPCFLHYFTGLHCPGCGTTRAAYSMLHGDWGAAIRANPLLFFGGIPLALAIWRDRQLRLAGQPGWRWLTRSVLVVLAVYFALRNLPTPDLGWLAPR
jgi:hypothetical protein